MFDSISTGAGVGMAFAPVLKIIVDIIRNRVKVEGRYVHLLVLGLAVISATVAVSISQTLSITDWPQIVSSIASATFSAIGITEITPDTSIIKRRAK